MPSPAIQEPATPAARVRPALFRALGNSEPPETITVDGREYRLETVFKHDSWAATAVYAPLAGGPRIVCKFNRRQSILGLPAGWIGRWLARRESAFLRRLEPLHQVPRCLGTVTAHGQPQRNACARTFIEGHPLGRYETVNDEFFPSLHRLLDEMHARGIAYVDLHKRENILVGDDGQPYLIDFQVCAATPESLHRRLPGLRGLLAPLFRMDRYHVAKHHQRLRPDQCGLSRDDVAGQRPLWVRFHRLIAQPLRQLRRGLLVRLGIRKADGRAHSEAFPEDAIRRELEATPGSASDRKAA